VSQESQLVCVLDAIQEIPAAFTALEIEAETGLPRKHVAAYITALKARGEVRDTGRFVRNYEKARPAKLFEMVRL
jgi:hypothetical protein